MRYFLFFIFAVCLASTQMADAHPTSYEGAKGVMGFHSPEFTHNQLNYSWKYWLATGAHYFHAPEQELEAAFASFNFLLNRWNTDKLQANLYLGAGPGIIFNDLKDKESGMGFLQFDIENRDYYFLVKHTELFTEEESELSSTTVRVGFTPYVAKSGQLHSWFILEYGANQFIGTKKEDLTPLLRIFYRNLLFEIGQSFKGQTHFNYILHF